MILVDIIFVVVMIGIIFKGLGSYFKYGEALGEESSPQEIIIKNGKVDVNRIQEYTGTLIKDFEFRPKTFGEFIGQDEAKEKAKTIIKRVNRNIKSHLFVQGIQGHGKTTYIRILANTLNAELIERIGKQVNEDTIVDIINLINNSEKENVVFFIDEVDSMNPKDVKILNPIIESFEIAGKRIKPFIFACATINDEQLVDNNPDTLDRIPIKIPFKRYNSLHIQQIIKQFKEQIFLQDNVPQEVIKTISENCKFNPRTANSLLSDYIVEQNINKVLRDSQIIKNGLTVTDIKILNKLAERDKPIGEEALAQKVGIKKKQYKIIYEPFLAEYGYIERTLRGRIISDKGKQILLGI